MSWRYYFHPATYNLIIKQNGFFMTDKVMKIYTLMVNTLWNTSERITSTPKEGSSSALKKIVATAIALTLSGQPAEAKTYNKQEFPTEMVANIPWTVSPMTENVEQSSVPNYVNQAQIAVKKYYPQYEEYFKDIINKIQNIWWYGNYLLNKEIKKQIWISWWLLTNEKDISTTILISFENIIWKQDFKKNIWITNNDNKYFVAKNITERFYNNYEKQIKNIKNFERDFSIMSTKVETKWIDEIENEYIELSEKYMPLLKDRLISYWELSKSKEIQKWIELYINIIKRGAKNPSQIWQKYIDEYNKIKK